MNQRYYSLDVFRGATVALMILVNNPGSWSHIYAPLDHAEWHGCTPTDLVFPFFLFAVGNALAFVIPRLEAGGGAAFWKKILWRTALIFLIGIFLNWFPFIKWDHDQLIFKPWSYLDAAGKEAGVRIPGVLQRIALAYFFASVIVYYFKLRGAFVTAAVILFGYWFLCIAGNPADPYSLQGWFGTAIDKKIFGTGHLYTGEGIPFDPEGLMSLFAAIVQVLFGYFAGNYIITKGKTPAMLNGLFVAGCVLIFTGFCWDMVFPINKKIWTSSYTIYTTGLALLVISIMIYLIEFREQRGWWSRFFDVFGKNALFIFILSGIIPRLLALYRIPGNVSGDGKQSYITPRDWFYEQVGKNIFSDPRNASLLYALCFILLMWSLAWILDKKKIYIKV
jgi:predicted acyltransferase